MPLLGIHKISTIKFQSRNNKRVTVITIIDKILAECAFQVQIIRMYRNKNSVLFCLQKKTVINTRGTCLTTKKYSIEFSFSEICITKVYSLDTET